MNWLTSIVLLASLCAPFKFAFADGEKEKSCNDQAKEKTGEERKTFMTKCMSGTGKTAGERAKMTVPVPDAITAPSNPAERRRECNKKAKDMNSRDRAKFMDECTKGN